MYMKITKCYNSTIIRAALHHSAVWLLGCAWVSYRRNPTLQFDSTIAIGRLNGHLLPYAETDSLMVLSIQHRTQIS